MLHTNFKYIGSHLRAVMKFTELKFKLIFTFVLFLPFLTLESQQNNYLLTDERPSLQILRVSEPPILDGIILEDNLWQNVSPTGQMLQMKPNYGEKASESTEIRLAYDDQNLYVAVICYDQQPENLVVTDARRDASLDNTDSFIFILDTFNDEQNGFMFGTNPLGAQYDAQVDNEGQGNFSSNRQQSGVIGGFNLNWDASWEVKTLVNDLGWTAEFAIPLRTLRYATGQDQTWGINFRRNIRKTNEVNFWSLLPVGFDLKRLSLAGKMHGLDLQSPGNLKVIPYTLAQVSKDFAQADPETETDFEAGVDLKYSVTPSLTLDLTYNTDFAQVEVDEQQINLDRFNLFFPEKRPFFLENAGLFTVGAPGEVDLFFSRRIGIGPEGELVPIIGGARLSGKMNRTNIGLLSMFTNEVSGANIDENNFTVARIQHEFKGRSALGGVFTNRQGIGGSEDGDHNRVYALDGKLGLGEKAQLTGFLAKSSSPDLQGSDHALQFNAEYEWNNWRLSAAFMEVAENFNPEIGFLSRTAFRKFSSLIFKYLRMNGKWGLFEIRPHIVYRGFWAFDGRMETSYLHIDNHWEWESGLEIHTGINFTTEGVFEPFEISENIVVPIETYDHAEAQIVFFTNRSKPLSISTRHVWGGFFGGSRKSNLVTLRARIGDKFNSEFTLSHNDINLPQGDFTTNLLRFRLSYSFTPTLFLQSLIQYNNVSETWSTNLRFGWLQKANTGLFVVYNESRDDIGIEQRSFTIKYSYLFDVLD